MKIHLRVVALGAGLMSLVLCAGCEEQSAKADEVPAHPDAVPPRLLAADEPKPVEQKAAETTPAQLEAPVVADSKATTAVPVKADTNAVQQLGAPDQLKLTPALADVIKLVQAGVGDEVLMTYITNSSDIFNMGPNEILYLHDLGVPAAIITTLIQRDSTPEAMARKQAAGAVQPLPPGVALTAPAANVYPPRAVSLPASNAPATAETAAVSTNAPPAQGEATPAVVYTVPTVVEQPANVSYFYSELDPYGTWVDYPGYGRCWRPTIAVWNSSWRPYADGGRWLWTDCGWYWYSDYSWGAHAFHYGRWTCPAGVGWLWVPDVHWGPAWVSWRHARSHCGWAPLPPSAHWVAGHGFYHNTLSVGVSFEFGLSDFDYVFLPTGRFCDRRPSNYYLASHHARSVHRESTVFNNYVASNHRPIVNNGVGFDRIASATRGSIRQVSVRTGDATVSRSTRREQLDNDGRTLTVTSPVRTVPAITSPSKPISSLSHLRAGQERRTAASGSPQNPSVNSTATRATASTAQQENPANVGTSPVADSGSRAKPIIMRGTSRASSSSTAVPTVAGPAREQPANTVDSGANSSGNASTARRAALPGGGRTAPATVDRPRQTGQPATVRSAPASAPASQQPARIAGRPEPVRVVSQPNVQRAPVVSAPMVVQPRIAPSSSPMPRATMPSAPTSPRVESYRSPSPAPSVTRSAPAQPSGGGSRSSRSSNDDGGRRSSR